MRSRILFLCILFVAGALRADSAYFFVFLNANPDRPNIEKDSMERLQVGHLENMNRLYGEGKLVVSGPFGDKQAGGVFVFKASSLEEVDGLLQTDPAIRAKRYILEIFPLTIAHGSICTAPDIFALEQYPFVKFSLQKSLTEQNRKSHTEYYAKLAADKTIIFHGSLGATEQVAIFAKNDKLDDAKKIVMEDPAVREAQIRPTFRVWWNAPGVFCEPVEE